MKVMQLNCWGGKLSIAIKRMMDREQPDIVCLQEAIDITKRPGSVIDPFSDFLPNSQYPHVAFAPTFSMRYMHETFNLGNAIVSKVPINNTHIEFTAGKFKKDVDSLNGDHNIRNFVHAELNIADKVFNVFSYHGYHDPLGKDGAPLTKKQMLKLAEYIRKISGPIILCGDFNLHPQSYSLKPINSILNNLPVEYGVESTRTAFAKRQEVIDFVFVSTDIAVLNFQALDDLVSDHKALILEF